MSNFPGENIDIPKRLLESLEGQPLDYLIPKSGLSDLIDPTRSVSIPLVGDAFFPPPTEALDQSSQNIIELDTNKRKYVFRRPKNWNSNEKNGAEPALNMMESLSPLAKQCLKATNIEVHSDDIRDEPKVLPKKVEKHKLEATGTNTIDLNVENNTKKMKVGSNVTVNLASLAQRYMGDLMAFLDEIEKDATSEYRNVEYWAQLPNKHYVLTEGCLGKLQMAMNNSLSIRGSSENIDVDKLVRLLDILVFNIKIAESYATDNLEDQELNRIAHASVSLIFTTFLLEGNDKRLSLERYILTPLEFIGNSVRKIKKSLTDLTLLRTELSLLHQSISLLPSYIYQKPFLDKGLITKLIYIFTDLLMDNELDSVSNTVALQYGRDNVKLESTNILVSLFSKLPDQRELIIEELLSNVEKLPVKRVQRRLRKVENDIFVTDFTMTVILLLETLNSYDYAKTIATTQPDLIPVVGETYSEDTRALNGFANQLAESIFDRFVKSTTNYRHVLENYVQDLIALLPFPQWCVSQDLLYFITRKLLFAYDPLHPQSANVESTCLHLLGSIGLAMFEIKCSTNPEDANNLVRLFNSPTSLPTFFKYFDNCFEFTGAIERQSAGKYLWHKKFGILMGLDEYADNVEDRNGGKLKLTIDEVKKMGEGNTSIEKPINKLDSQVVRKSYFSILHALDLLNMYEPYLKLILSILGKNKVKLKSTAIKCLSLLASADQSILNSPMVKSTIGKTLQDPSASVKDAVLDLISIGSSYLEYYQQLNVNYDDESVLIRKHVLKINGNIYDETKSLESQVFVASRILLKIEDEEDNIIEMARNMLLEKWIFPVKADDNLLEKQSAECKNILSVMSSVATMNTKCSQLFDWYLNFFLLNKQLHSPEVYDCVLRSLNKLTDPLVQGIVELQSTEATESNILLKQKFLVLLSKFADCSSSFITKDHIIALYPYVVSDEKSNLQFHILHVFKNTMQNLSNFKPKFLFDLETTLLSRLPRMSVKEIGEAMPLIWCVATNRKDISRVTKACSSCFQHMSPYINTANRNPGDITVESKLQRLIYLSAAFARFCKFPNKEVKPVYVQSDEPVYEYVAKCLLLLSRQGIPHVIRRISVKALTQLCGDHPKLFNSKHILNLLDDEFESDHLDIKLVILESLYDFFMAEESKLIKQTGVNVSVSSNAVPKSEKKKESISGDGICAALVGRFLKHILKICLSEDIKSSLVAVRSLKLILQYGYTNPSHCIPTVIALVGSTNHYLRNIAIEVLTELFEKYETMVFAGVSQGVKITVDYCKVLEGPGFYKNDSFLIALQKIMANNKKNSTKFFKSITRVLQIYFNQIVESDCDSETRDGILFLTNNLPLLKFPTQYELVALVKVIELESNQLKEAIMDEFEQEQDIGVSVENVKNSIVAEMSLFEVKNLFVHLYGIKSDVISEAEDSTLRNKPLHTIAFQSHLGERIGLIMAQYEREDMIQRYVNSQN
ncbi:hypothetical protein ZYGR_0AI01660 [Zygosaccharomyces rouxii]|uniref:Sister chromatid cohesion protein n=1 Tax=Zygosaccharomyces rouxii TaxID=4956 RepID=A0A1Q3AAV2_ZYGRO|nr:hypothetical protein ZYGR_0AI01660 [Zygosaccharomyces rouxii]